VAILAGRGALHATDELEQVAERLGAPIIKALLGRAAVPDDSPYTTGGLGLLGTRPSQEAMERCDTLLMVGTSFPYIEFLPKPGQARAVQIDLDAARLGLRYPVEVGLAGDSRQTPQVLLPWLEYQHDRSFLAAAQRGMRDWWALMAEQGARRDTPMKPQAVAWELGQRLPPTAIVSADSGTITTWWARHIPVRRGQLHAVSGTLASMGCGLPYAIAAQLAYPDRLSVALVGDGGFTMLMGEFATAVKYQLPIKVIVVKNNTLGQIKWEQMVFLGNPESGCELQPIDFAAFAHACGGTGYTVEDPADCGRILDQALATPGPVVVQAVVDPFEPPMPAKITLDQATKFAQALARGSRQLTTTRTFGLPQGGRGFHVYVPVIVGGQFEGVIAGIFRVEALLDALLAHVAPGYGLAVFEGTQEIYGRYEAGRKYAREWGQEAALGLAGVTWRVQVWPTQTPLDEYLSPLPEVSLATGLLTSGLLALLLHLALTTRQRAKAVAGANDALQAEIRQHQQTEAALAACIQQMEAVRAVTMEITRELDLTALLSLITQRAVSLVGPAQAGAIYLWDDSGQVLVPHAWHGRGAWMQDVRIPLGEGIVGTVAQRQTGLVVDDYQTSPYRLASVGAYLDATAVMAEPLLYRERLVGVIALDNGTTAQPFGDEDQALLQLFAAQAAIENARLYEALEARLRRLQMLTRVNQVVSSSLDLSKVLGEIAWAAAVLMDAAVVSFWLVDEATRTLEVQAFSDEAVGADFLNRKLAFEQGGVGWVAAHRRPLNVPDICADERFATEREWCQAHELTSFFGMPILHEEGLLGGLAFNGRQPFCFGPEEHSLLESFAAQAAVALRNARLFAEVQARSLHLSHLNAELEKEIAERKRAVDQLQRQQEALFQSEKLAAMGALLASVAHELNNPLSVVTMQADLLSDEIADEALAERVRLISQSAERCVRIVQNFLALARQNPPQRTQVALNAVVEEALQILAYTLNVDDIDVQWQAAEGLPPLWADPHQLHQVVVNLLTNAYQALRGRPPPRRLTLRTRANAERTRVYLDVADNGPGIPPGLRERIFEPFFTTKPPGVGTGLGLPFCQGIVEGHGGTIHVASQPGQGATFTVELPVEQPPRVILDSPAAEVVRPIQGKAILVIDDEPGITSALSYLLRRDGHTVETAAHGRQGLARLQERDYDLILCDLRMPELDGPGFYRELAQRYPHLLRRVIFLTGDTLSPETRRFLEEVGVPRLGKPFRAAEVRRVVHHALQTA
jgi:signal transduction histidine kinase/putative methionine-R-sulfoxide reductase with GAF domain